MNTELLVAPNWHLEGFIGDSPNLRIIPLDTLPFRIGCRPGSSLCLSFDSISKDHAEIVQNDDTLSIRDLGSRNGTFVNGQRVQGEAPLQQGDVIHLANIELRVGRAASTDGGATIAQDSNQWIWSIADFERLFDGTAAVPHFQPIVNLRTEHTVGYEVLARSSLDGLRSPKQMFSVAEQIDMAFPLSRLFRTLGVQHGQRLPSRTNLFLNTHPEELDKPELLVSLDQLRESAPHQPLTLEIHEAAITDPRAMRNLRSALTDLEIKLAYDDFGAGQARLIDLVEVPPDYLKFDICLVRDIHNASAQRRQLLETLVRMTHDLGVAVLAEGIECQAEGEACAQLGFDYAQGYYYGKPAPAPGNQPVGKQSSAR